MTTSDDAITKDQTALDAEQATQAPPAYVTVEDFNAMRTELTSQLRGLQGSVDRTASQVSQERADTDRQRRVNALEGQLQDADPATKVLLEDRIQEIRSTPTPQVPPEPVVAQNVDTLAQHRAFLESISINPSLPGIDWAQDLSSAAGQTAFVKSAVNAKVAATQQVAQRQANPPPAVTANPPIESPVVGNGTYRTAEDALDAMLMHEISHDTYRELLAGF